MKARVVRSSWPEAPYGVPLPRPCRGASPDADGDWWMTFADFDEFLEWVDENEPVLCWKESYGLLCELCDDIE